MSQICAQCNAPLPLGPSGTIAKCAYCGTDTRIAGEATPGIVVINDPALRARLQKELTERSAEEDAKKEAEQRFVNKASLAVFFILFLIIVFCILSSRS